jgi:hypothetical protein
MSYAFGAEASVSFGTGGARASASSGSGGSKAPTAADKALAAELAKKGQAEAQAAIASDLGAAFFDGETSKWIPARQAINQTIALYNQARDMALAGQVLMVTGMNVGVSAQDRATDYEDRVEELDVASAEIVKQFISRLHLKVAPKAPTPSKLPLFKLTYFPKSTGIKPANLLMARLGPLPGATAPAAEEPFPWLWVGIGAAALGVGALFIFK